jgi:predicted short-subunit dehydrogenase-like oxidoreductase (DUF2520 family)
MKIAIIGKGNVGTHLNKIFTEHNINVILVESRTLANIPLDANLYIIAVKDDAIPDVANALKKTGIKDDSIVAHTSGSVGISILSTLFNNTAVFYPLQTFSKTVAVDFTKITFFIETNNDNTFCSLQNIAYMIGASSCYADSNRRKQLHIAAVICCNFVNHLWTIADEYIEQAGIDPIVLRPLIEETFNKIITTRPAEAQTGPARRGDIKIIESHIETLANNKPLQEIYRILSNSILTRYNNTNS